MDEEFWLSRWRDDDTPFHRDEVNYYLQTFAARVAPVGAERFFVPLCGKAFDMAWLCQHGYSVLGVELSHIAVQSFFKEQCVKSRQSRTKHHQHLRGGAVELLSGDLFKMTVTQLAGVSAVYDRAALVALPANMRRRYANHLKKILPRRVSILLVALEYHQYEMSGPPFSVDGAEIRDLFADQFAVEHLAGRPILQLEPGLRKRGLSYLLERAYHLSRG